MFPFITLLTSSVQTESPSQTSCAMETPDHSATVDQEAATAESTDEARTVPQDDPTVARPHLMTLLYRPDTPAKLTDKFPYAPLHKRHPATFVMGRGQNLDVLLNDEHMPRKFIELWCSVEEDGTPKWYVKNLSEKKPVRLELAGSKVTAKFNEVKELRDGHKLKLEMMVFVVRIEEGDLIEDAEFGLEFRVLEDGNTGSSGSFHRQTSSSTDSSGSITSATELARQAYGSSPVLTQNGFHGPVNHFGHALPVGGPAQMVGPAHPPGQFHPQGTFVYPLGGQVPAAGMAVHPGGGAMVYYPVTCTASLSGVGSHMSGASSHSGLHGHCSHLDCRQHHPTPQVCCHAGCNVQVNPVAPHIDQQPVLTSHASAGPGSHSGVGNHASANPCPYPGMGSHASAGRGSYPGINSHASAGSGPYPGVASHMSANFSPSLGPNSVFYNIPGGGSGPPQSGPLPPSQSSVPSANRGPHGQQALGQPALAEGMAWVRHQSSAAALSHNDPSQTKTSLPGSNHHFSPHYQSPHEPFPSNDSTKIKELLTTNYPGSPNVSARPDVPTDQSVSFQYPTLYTQEHQNARFSTSGEFPSSHHPQQQQQQQQNQTLLSDRLHGPMSMPPDQNWMLTHDQRGFSSHGQDESQRFVRAPAVISQPESAAVSGMPVQQPQSALVHEVLAQQPESAVMHNLSERQSQSSMVHNMSAGLCESATMHNVSGSHREFTLPVQNLCGQQPESATLPLLREQLQQRSPSSLPQQATDSPTSNVVLVGTLGPNCYSPSGGLPAAPPVGQLSRLTLSTPVEVTTPFPTEVMSATPANSLSHSSTGGSSESSYYVHTPTTTPVGVARSSHNEMTRGDGGSNYDQQSRGAMPFIGDGSAQDLDVSANVPPSQQMYSAPELRQYVNFREVPLSSDGAHAAFSSLSEVASNGNQINLRSHEGIAAPTPPSSDFSSEGSYRVQDLQQVIQGAGQDPEDRRRRQPQEDDERRPQEHEEQH